MLCAPDFKAANFQLLLICMSLLDVIQVTEQRTITVQVAGKMNSQCVSQRREAAPVRWPALLFSLLSFAVCRVDFCN